MECKEISLNPTTHVIRHIHLNANQYLFNEACKVMLMPLIIYQDPRVLVTGRSTIGQHAWAFCR